MNDRLTVDHHAWRFVGDRFLYVEEIKNTHLARGDKYAYTTTADKALPMTADECRAFCAYMKLCGTDGYWS